MPKPNKADLLRLVDKVQTRSRKYAVAYGKALHAELEAAHVAA